MGARWGRNRSVGATVTERPVRLLTGHLAVKSNYSDIPSN